MMDADQATAAMVKAMQADGEESGVVIDKTLQYSSVTLRRIGMESNSGRLTSEEILQDEHRRLLHRDIGPALMRLLTEAEEPLAVWLREMLIHIGHNGTNGGVRIVVETIPLRKVL